MYHSITIGGKNTWDDWHLIPASRPLFNPPEVKTNMVEIPGGDGAIDLTSALAGRAVYKNRVGSWKFYVENGFKDWSVLYSEIMSFLHGQRMRAVLEDDPDYYYEGRFSVNAWESSANWSTITIDYDVSPYKKSFAPDGNDWLWDTFNFETDRIQSLESLPVDGTLTVQLSGEGVSLPPSIICSDSGMTLTFEGTTYTLAKGVNYFSDLILQNGDNTFTFTGQGTVTIKCERGRL